MTRRQRILLWGSAAALLLLPLIVMQFTDEMNWDGSDFRIFGVMLAVACGGVELVARLTAKARYRALAAITIAAGFLWLWAELAVGVFTDWGS